MSDVPPTAPNAQRHQLLQRLQQISQSNQAGAYATVAQMLLGEIEPVRLVSALLSQVAAQPSTRPITDRDGARGRRDVARMA